MLAGIAHFWHHFIHDVMNELASEFCELIRFCVFKRRFENSLTGLATLSPFRKKLLRSCSCRESGEGRARY